jgi:hypothetical protein
VTIALPSRSRSAASPPATTPKLLVYADGVHAFNAFPIGIANAAQTAFTRGAFSA